MVLDGTGIDETGWVASRLVSCLPPPVTVTALSDQLKHSKKVDDHQVLAVLQDLELLGLLKREGDVVSLTVVGTRRFQQISDQINEFTNQIWDGLGSDELATAARVLTTITQGRTRSSRRDTSLESKLRWMDLNLIVSAPATWRNGGRHDWRA
jgi:hypothetical protein